MLLDSEMTMKQHINHVVSIGYYHLRRLRQLRRHITQDAMTQLVFSLILRRIDYCNSILIGLPASSTAPPLLYLLYCTTSFRLISNLSFMSKIVESFTLSRPPSPQCMTLPCEQSTLVKCLIWCFLSELGFRYGGP